MVNLATLEDFNKHAASGLLNRLANEGIAAAIAKQRAFGLTPVTQDNLNDVPAPAKVRPSPKKPHMFGSARKRAAA